MIRIQENCEGRSIQINQIAQQFLSIVNSIKEDGSYIRGSIGYRLVKAIGKWNSNNQIDEITLKSESTRINQLNFLVDLYCDLNNYLIGDIDELSTLINKVYKDHTESLFTSKNGDEYTITKFGDFLIDTIFKYSSYRSKPESLKIIESLNLKNSYCPYCNIHLIEIVQERLGLFDLDHFFSKARFPFLSCSFYNLIPCCKYCNQGLKRDDEFELDKHINPYRDSFHNDHLFKVDPFELLNDGNLDNLISLKELKTNKWQSNKTFELEDRYIERIKSHKKLIELLTTYRQTDNAVYDEFFEADKPLSECQILKHQDGKLLYDLLKQLRPGIIKPR